jgi:hypothetical protein
MVTRSAWRPFYQVLPDGRCRIAKDKLADVDAHRVLDARMNDGPAKVILLDKPFLLGPAVRDSAGGYYLIRIRLRDLPGWPPRIAPENRQPRFPGALRCSLRSAVYKPEHGDVAESVEFEIECRDSVYKVWHVGCPAPLLRCVAATLKLDGARGKKLSDLQEMRLVGAE